MLTFQELLAHPYIKYFNTPPTDGNYDQHLNRAIRMSYTLLTDPKRLYKKGDIVILTKECRNWHLGEQCYSGYLSPRTRECEWFEYFLMCDIAVNNLKGVIYETNEDNAHIRFENGDTGWYAFTSLVLDEILAE